MIRKFEKEFVKCIPANFINKTKSDNCINKRELINDLSRSKATVQSKCYTNKSTEFITYTGKSYPVSYLR